MLYSLYSIQYIQFIIIYYLFRYLIMIKDFVLAIEIEEKQICEAILYIFIL